MTSLSCVIPVFGQWSSFWHKFPALILSSAFLQWIRNSTLKAFLVGEFAASLSAAVFQSLCWLLLQNRSASHKIHNLAWASLKLLYWMPAPDFKWFPFLVASSSLLSQVLKLELLTVCVRQFLSVFLNPCLVLTLWRKTQLPPSLNQWLLIWAHFKLSPEEIFSLTKSPRYAWTICSELGYRWVSSDALKTKSGTPSWRNNWTASQVSPSFLLLPPSH